MVNSTQRPETTTELLARRKEFKGVQAAVVRRLARTTRPVTPSMVSKVANGAAKSARVERVLLAEIRRRIRRARGKWADVAVYRVKKGRGNGNGAGGRRG